MRAVGHAPHLVDDRLGEAVPFDGRVARRLLRIEQVAILDEQQRVDQQRRHRFEARIDPLREARHEGGLAAAFAQLQAGLVLLAVDREQAAIEQIDHARRHARLGAHAKALALEPLDEFRQLAVAQPLVVRARLREADGVARPGADLEAQLARDPGEAGGLQAMGAYFVDDQPGGRADDGDHRGGGKQGSGPFRRQQPGRYGHGDSGRMQRREDTVAAG